MNSPPTIFLSDKVARECPALFEWAKLNCLHMQPAYDRMGWDVWLPMADVNDGARVDKGAAE